MVISTRILVLFLLLLLTSGCDNRETKEANDFAAKVFRAWDDYTGELERRYEKAEMPEVPEMPNLMPESVSKAIDEHSSKMAEAAGAAAAEQASKQVAKQVGAEIDDVKQKASAVGDMASSTARSAERSARYYVRKLPRSQREANDLVVEKGRGWGEQLNRYLEQLGANGGIFGRRAGSSSSYSKSPKPRLKGRSSHSSGSRTPDRLRR